MENPGKNICKLNSNSVKMNQNKYGSYKLILYCKCSLLSGIIQKWGLHLVFQTHTRIWNLQYERKYLKTALNVLGNVCFLFTKSLHYNNKIYCNY